MGIYFQQLWQLLMFQKFQLPYLFSPPILPISSHTWCLMGIAIHNCVTSPYSGTVLLGRCLQGQICSDAPSAHTVKTLQFSLIETCPNSVTYFKDSKSHINGNKFPEKKSCRWWDSNHLPLRPKFLYVIINYWKKLFVVLENSLNW